MRRAQLPTPAQSSRGDERSPDTYRRFRRTSFLCHHITGPLKRRYTPCQLHTVTVRTAPRSVLRVYTWRDAQGIDKRVAAATYTDAADRYRGTATLVCPPGGSCDVRCWAGMGLNVMSLHINTENILYGALGGEGGKNIYCPEGVPRQCPLFLLVTVRWNFTCGCTCLSNGR